MTENTDAQPDPPPGASDRRAAKPSWFRSAGRLFVSVLLACLGLVAALGTLGQIVRDRSAVWAVLMYIPLPVVGLAAVALDAACAGRAMRRRFLLSALGLAAAVASSWPMWGRGRGISLPAESNPVRLLQWNVRWGGNEKGEPGESAQAIIRQIVRRRPDIVAISESPNTPWLADLAQQLGPNWNFVKSAFPNNSRAYRCRFGLLARGEITLESQREVSDGRLACAVVNIDGRPIRLLLVDGRSELRIWRTPLLRDVRAEVEAAAARGAPIDVLVGDFNSVSRSRGFDSFGATAGGFHLASRSATGWRGTFPAWAPLYDIDHVWLRNDWPIAHAELFTDFNSDHRGQVVAFVPRPTVRP